MADQSKIRRFIEQLYGNEMPPLNPYYRERRDELKPVDPVEGVRGGQRMTEAAFGALGDIAMQPVRAGQAVGDAAFDPTLANITNAGVQTGFALGSPAMALGSFGLGSAEAIRRDMGLDATSEAAASDDPLLPDQRARLEALNKMKSLTRAQREEKNSYLSVLEKAASATAQAKAKEQELAAQSKQKEYDAAVGKADAARAEGLARDRRFSDTDLGKVFDATGGAAPVLAGGMFGALNRLATGPAARLSPTISGATAGVTALNVPLAYNSFMTEPDNPEKVAYTGYARELPPDHPRKAEFDAYAKSLPQENPVRAQAQEELYDPLKLAERVGFGIVEGGLGGLAGGELANLPRRLAKEALRGPGAASSGQASSRAGSAQNSAETGATGGQAPQRQPYSSLPPEVRSRLQDEYRRDVATNYGEFPKPKTTAKRLSADLASEGINVPVSANRVKETNSQVAEFIKREGRPPTTRDEWAKVFNDKTLSLAGGGLALSELPPEVFDALIQQLLAQEGGS